VNDDGLPNNPPPVTAGSMGGWDADRSISSVLSLSEDEEGLLLLLLLLLILLLLLLLRSILLFPLASSPSSSTFTAVVVTSPLDRLLLLDDDDDDDAVAPPPKEDSSSSIFLPFNLVRHLILGGWISDDVIDYVLIRIISLTSRMIPVDIAS
jgi:hypothetical protein